MLSTMVPSAAWTKDEASRMRKKAYQFFLLNGKIWQHLKKRISMPLRVAVKKEEQSMLFSEFHDSPCSRHRGTQATFEKLKGK